MIVFLVALKPFCRNIDWIMHKHTRLMTATGLWSITFIHIHGCVLFFQATFHWWLSHNMLPFSHCDAKDAPNLCICMNLISAGGVKRKARRPTLVNTTPNLGKLPSESNTFQRKCKVFLQRWGAHATLSNLSCTTRNTATINRLTVTIKLFTIKNETVLGGIFWDISLHLISQVVIEKYHSLVAADILWFCRNVDLFVSHTRRHNKSTTARILH